MCDIVIRMCMILIAVLVVSIWCYPHSVSILYSLLIALREILRLYMEHLIRVPKGRLGETCMIMRCMPEKTCSSEGICVLNVKLGDLCGRYRHCSDAFSWCQDGECHCHSERIQIGGECVIASDLGKPCFKDRYCFEEKTSCQNKICRCITGTRQRGHECVQDDVEKLSRPILIPNERNDLDVEPAPEDPPTLQDENLESLEFDDPNDYFDNVKDGQSWFDTAHEVTDASDDNVNPTPQPVGGDGGKKGRERTFHSLSTVFLGLFDKKESKSSNSITYTQIVILYWLYSITETKLANLKFYAKYLTKPTWKNRLEWSHTHLLMTPKGSKKSTENSQCDANSDFDGEKNKNMFDSDTCLRSFPSCKLTTLNPILCGKKNLEHIRQRSAYLAPSCSKYGDGFQVCGTITSSAPETCQCVRGWECSTHCEYEIFPCAKYGTGSLEVDHSYCELNTKYGPVCLALCHPHSELTNTKYGPVCLDGCHPYSKITNTIYGLVCLDAGHPYSELVNTKYGPVYLENARIVDI